MENNDVKYYLLLNNEENILAMERLRMDSKALYLEDNEIINGFYANELRNGKLIVFACFYKGELVAGCYVSSLLDTLYIDNLFVKKDYQGKGLYFGRNLLLYILRNKEIVEKYFKIKLTQSTIVPISKKTENIYKKIGYNPPDNFYGIMRKNI